MFTNQWYCKMVEFEAQLKIVPKTLFNPGLRWQKIGQSNMAAKQLLSPSLFLGNIRFPTLETLRFLKIPVAIRLKGWAAFLYGPMAYYKQYYLCNINTHTGHHGKTTTTTTVI